MRATTTRRSAMTRRSRPMHHSSCTCSARGHDHRGVGTPASAQAMVSRLTSPKPKSAGMLAARGTARRPPGRPRPHRADPVVVPAAPSPALEAEPEQVGEVPAAEDDQRVGEHRDDSGCAGPGSRHLLVEPGPDRALIHRVHAPFEGQRRRHRAQRQAEHAQVVGQRRLVHVVQRITQLARQDVVARTRAPDRRHVRGVRSRRGSAREAKSVMPGRTESSALAPRPADSAPRSAAPRAAGRPGSSSPRSTSISCGSSSSLLRRRQRPTRVTRASSPTVSCRPRAPASATHGAELVDAEGRPSRPTRCWRKNTGPRESSLIAQRRSASEQRRQQQQAQPRASEVEDTLGHAHCSAMPRTASITRCTSASLMCVYSGRLTDALVGRFGAAGNSSRLQRVASRQYGCRCSGMKCTLQPMPRADQPLDERSRPMPALAAQAEHVQVPGVRVAGPWRGGSDQRQAGEGRVVALGDRWRRALEGPRLASAGGCRSPPRCRSGCT